jgi:hypothetical protein
LAGVFRVEQLGACFGRCFAHIFIPHFTHRWPDQRSPSLPALVFRDRADLAGLARFSFEGACYIAFSSGSRTFEELGQILQSITNAPTKTVTEAPERNASAPPVFAVAPQARTTEARNFRGRTLSNQPTRRWLNICHRQLIYSELVSHMFR